MITIQGKESSTYHGNIRQHNFMFFRMMEILVFLAVQHAIFVLVAVSPFLLIVHNILFQIGSFPSAVHICQITHNHSLMIKYSRLVLRKRYHRISKKVMEYSSCKVMVYHFGTKLDTKQAFMRSNLKGSLSLHTSQVAHQPGACPVSMA